jgi:hypothetical protein
MMYAIVGKVAKLDYMLFNLCCDSCMPHQLILKYCSYRAYVTAKSSVIM